LKKSAQLIVSLVVAALAIYYTLRNVSLAELMESFRHVHYIYLIPGVLIVALTFVLRAYRWRVLLTPVKQVKARELASPLMVGFMASVLPARAGELVRAYLLGKKHNLPFVASFATIVVERLFDMIMLMLLFGWILVFHSDIFNSGVSFSGISIRDLAFNFGIFTLVVLSGLIGFIFLLAFQKEKAVALVRWLTRLLPDKWQTKIEQLMETFSQGLAVVRDGTALFKITLASAGVWTLIVTQYYPLYLAYDLQTLSAESMIFLTVLVAIMITALPTPAFLGSMNAAVLIALHDVMGEAEVAAVSFGFVSWAINFGVIFAGGLYFILHDHISFKNLTNVPPPAGEADS